MIEAVQNAKIDISIEEIQNYQEEYEFVIRTDTLIDTAITYAKCAELIRYLAAKHQELNEIVKALSTHYNLEILVKSYLSQAILTTPYEIRIHDYLVAHGDQITSLIRFVKGLKSEEHTTTKERLT